MAKYVYLVCGWLLCFFSGCHTRPGNADGEVAYNPHVEAFTSGTISRFAPVYLIFNEQIPAGKMNKKQLNELVRIRPETAGEFDFENDRTIVFKPSGAFARNTRYQVKADLGDWFGKEDADRYFAFAFSTLPLAVKAHLQSVDINEKNENGYDVVFDVFTADRESAETVESLVRFSEKAPVAWQHGPDGKRHRVTLENVASGTEGTRKLVLSVAPNKDDVPEGELASAGIPDRNDFSVYDIRYVTDPERYVEVTFTKLLDVAQPMQGLAFIDGNKSDAVNAERNKLRLYPDAGLSGAVIVHLDKNIRSKAGIGLGKDVVKQIRIDTNLPQVEFVGNGVIIPQSTELTVPFRTVYLRGVTVRVIKVFEQNIGQFLQSNNLDGSSNLMQVGRPVALKTILFDPVDPADLSRWTTYSLDLRKLMEPEPGAIYRVQLSFDKQLSGYSCGEPLPVLSAAEVEAQDRLKFEEESNRFDNGGYYYFSGSYDWSHFNWEERNDPCTDSYYFNKVASKNVLATNLGLMAMAGEDNTMTVLVHNLLSTNPEQGVKVTLYNYQHQAVGSGMTDNKGTARISLDAGKPFYLIASLGKQRSYLRVDDGSSLSLSAFDVSGEVLQEGIRGFIYGERGVWRPGDTLHLAFMMNDRMHKLPADHPVTMELYNPLGQLYLRKTLTRGELGLYVFDMPTDANAPTGAWNVKVTVGGASFTKRLRIETIKPNRLKIDLTFPERVLLSGQPLDGRLHVEWLQGAVARNLKYEIQGTFISTPTVFKAYAGYVFDDPAKKFSSEESKLISGRTDDVGNATIDARIEIGNSAPGMLLGNLVTRVYEESGDFSIDASRLMYSPYRRYAGVWSPQKEGKQLDTGKSYTYRVASVDYLGKPQPDVKLEVDVYKVNWYWWWDSDYSGLANYISNSYQKKYKSFTLTTDSNGQASFGLEFDNRQWGTYFIRVKDPGSRHSAGILSYFDWPDNEGRRNRDGSESAVQLNFKTDKDVYAPGENLVVSFPSSEGSRAIVSVENGSRVLSTEAYTCRAGETKVTLKVTPDMQPNAYVFITLLQPHALTQNDLPIRMYGVAPFTVTSPGSHLNPVIRTAGELKPEAPYEITVSEKDGKEMAYTLAVVDEGLLDLTHFATPAPWKAFNARAALGVRTWDLYNYVVGTYGGRIEQMFSIGGDDALNKGPKAMVNRFRPVVVFDGPFLLKKGEKQKHRYTMPNYNGRVRIMVVAGNGEAYGDAEKSVLVRKPVMLLGTLPRVIGVGEEMVVPATVFATEPNIGNVEVTIGCSANMEIVGPAAQTLHFIQKEDKQALFRIRVKEKPGTGVVTLTATGKGEKSVYETEIEIRSVRQAQTRIIPVTLEPGKTWKESVELPGAAGTNSLALDVADVQPLNLGSRLDYLLEYPHGCLEQIVSKAFPQIYLPQLADLTADEKAAAEQAVKATVSQLRAYQTAEGAFAYWPGQTGTSAWGSVYAAHFLLEAEAHGYLVPEGMKRSLMANLRTVGRNWKAVDSYWTSAEELTQAYRLFVLTLAQQPEVGAMNRLKETSGLGDVSRWMLAAAYATIGRRDVALTLTEKTTDVSEAPAGLYAGTFGSPDRDKAIRLITLCLLDESAQAAQLAQQLSAAFGSDQWMSTQTTSFGLVALAAYMQRYQVAESMNFTYVYGGKTDDVSTGKHFYTVPLGEKLDKTSPLEIRNTGKATLFVRVITEGVPDEGEEKAYANGVSLAASYVSQNGGLLNVADLRQGDNFTAVVTVKNPSAGAYTNLALTQIFPAGWEILNTRFLDEPEQKDVAPAGVSYQDIRDDRVYSYIDLLPPGRQVTVKINLAAVYPGIFYLPPVRVEAMYNRLIQANTAGEKVEVK